MNRFWIGLIAAALAAACYSPTADGTSLFVQVDTSKATVSQLRFTVLDTDGGTLFVDGPIPDAGTATLTGPQSIRFLLNDSLDGHLLTVDVDGFLGGQRVSNGSGGPVKISKGSESDVSVTPVRAGPLDGGTDGGPGSDGGSDAGQLDAGTQGELCTSTGWCWEYPLPQGTNLLSSWESETGELWAVGDLGTAIRRTNGIWEVVSPPTLYRLRSVWGSDPAHVFAAGDNAVLWFWNGAAWNLEQAPAAATGMSLYGVSGTSPNDVWAVGATAGTGGAILHFNGQAWSAPITSATEYSALWVGSDGGWAVGGRGGTALDIWQLSAGQWNLAQSVTTSSLPYSVWANGAGQGWIVGQGGTTLELDAGTWVTPPFSAPAVDLYAVTGSGSDVNAAGETFLTTGDFEHLQPGGWANVGGFLPAGIKGLFEANPNDVFAVGNGGQMFEVTNGGTLLSALTSRPDTLDAIVGNPPRDLWVVGNAGVVAQYVGPPVEWSTVSTPWNLLQNLHGAWMGPGASDLWVVGDDQIFAHWNAGTARWEQHGDGGTTSLYGISGTADDDLWLVGQGGQVEHWDGTRVASVGAGTTQLLHAVWATPNDVWVVGDRYTMLHASLDGGLDAGVAFTPVTLPPNSANPNLYAITSCSNALYAVGAGGTILRSDGGTSWSPEVAPNTRDNIGALGRAPNGDCWSAGSAGSVSHRATTGWAAAPTYINNSLNGIYLQTGSDGGVEARVVGNEGTVLRGP